MTTKYEQIEKAVKTLGLPEKATLKQVKERYKKLISRWHPDKCKEDPKNARRCHRQLLSTLFIINPFLNPSMRYVQLKRQLGDLAKVVSW